MTGSKRKERPSPEILESDEDDHDSLVIVRGRESDRDTTQRRRRSTLEGEGYHNDDREVSRVRIRAYKPRGRGYRPLGTDRRTTAEYDGRHILAYYNQNPLSSRGPYHWSRSLEPYGRGTEWSGWWSDSREPWGRPRQGRYEEYALPRHPEEHYTYEYDMHDSRGGVRPTHRLSPGPPGMNKGE
jgi:hypothetical protein